MQEITTPQAKLMPAAEPTFWHLSLHSSSVLSEGRFAKLQLLYDNVCPFPPFKLRPLVCPGGDQVSDAATVTEIFSDGRQLEVVPLLQAFMFPAW